MKIINPGAEFDFTKHIRNLIQWTSADGFTVVVNADAQVNIEESSVRVLTMSDTGSDCVGLCSKSCLDIPNSAIESFMFDTVIDYLTPHTGSKVFIVFSDNFGLPPLLNDGQFGFLIDGQKLYGINGDWDNYTLTDLDTTVEINANRIHIKAIFYPLSRCEFYVNRVLKGTSITTLDTAGYYGVLVCAIQGERQTIAATIARLYYEIKLKTGV